MTLKILHVSDIHIRKLKYHTEYREVFAQLYEKAAAEKPDIILNTGDTFHTKTDLSSEAVQMMSELFSNLADIAPLHMILGNHDMNLRSLGRLDAISPVVDNLKHPNIHFHKYSDIIPLTDDIDMHILSIVDPDNWTKTPNKKKTNIAVYHGAVKGVKTDMGWTMEHGDIDISELNKYDFALLGDIHKTNQMVNSNPRFRYPGSLVQQNHGETNDKGFIVWEIENKDSYGVRHCVLENPKPFVTIILTKTGRLPKNAKVKDGARLRLVSNANISLDAMRRAVDVARHRFNPESVSFLSRAGTGKDDGESTPFIKENLRDINVQNKMIREHLGDYELEDEVLDRVISLNTKYNSIVESEEEVARNVNWKLDTFQWDNLFNYGEENSVDFSNLTGIVGIFGKNYSGKSSIVDAALYTLFNSTSKNERKNLNIINQNRELGMGRIGLSIGDRQFVVERTSEKYTKKLKGEETLEAKTNVDFTEIDALGNEIISHNGMTRADTDKNIRKMLGTLDDFLLTSMASQLDSLTFIKEGSTRRKEILAKFLDLEIFDKKYKLAKDDASDMRGALKRLEDKNFDEEMEQASKELAISDEDIVTNKQRCKDFEEKTLLFEAELQDLENKISSIPVNIIDIDDYRNKLKTKTAESAILLEENTASATKKKESEELVVKLIDFLDKYDIENLKNKKEEATNKESEKIEVENSLRSAEKDVIAANNKIKLLDEVPCGDKYTSCKFICNAHTAKEVLPSLNEQVSELRQQGEDILSQLDALEADKVDDYLSKYDALVNRRTAVEGEVSVLSLQIEGNISKIEVIRHEIEDIEKHIEIYEVNKDAIENLEHLVSDKKKKARDLVKIKKEHDECVTDLNDLFMAHGSYEQKLQNIEEQKAELSDLREEYSAYDLFTKCMHSSGISYDIIKRKLPAINEEIAKVLTNIVDFEVFFENDGRRLNVYIKHPRHEPRPIELGSGAEKTIASMAIRLALLHVSSLPSPSVFILDEPGTALDAENLEGFVRILEMVKSYFKTVILISHLDSLKDCVDHVISIEKENGFAKVVV